jgi:hypothetical protein
MESFGVFICEFAGYSGLSRNDDKTFLPSRDILYDRIE